jgi:hypothetical protein
MTNNNTPTKAELTPGQLAAAKERFSAVVLRGDLEQFFTAGRKDFDGAFAHVAAQGKSTRAATACLLALMYAEAGWAGVVSISSLMGAGKAVNRDGRIMSADVAKAYAVAGVLITEQPNNDPDVILGDTLVAYRSSAEIAKNLRLTTVEAATTTKAVKAKATKAAAAIVTKAAEDQRAKDAARKAQGPKARTTPKAEDKSDNPLTPSGAPKSLAAALKVAEAALASAPAASTPTEAHLLALSAIVANCERLSGMSLSDLAAYGAPKVTA